MENKTLNRRKFLQQVSLFSVGLTLVVPRFSISKAFASSPPVSRLVVVKGSNYGQITREAVATLGGMNQFVRSGDSVVIKPNIGWDRSVEQGANTHPLVVKALVEMVLEAGGSRVLVFDHTCNEKRRCYRNSGMEEVLGAMGRAVKLEHIDDRKFIPVDIEKGISLTRWDIYKEALLADCYINVPAAKHHGLSRLTLGLKNNMGVIGGNRGRLHHDLGQKLADLATVVKPQLTVVDATRMLMKNGPQGGRIKDVRKADTVVASADPVAADAYATTLFGLRPEEISSTVAAHKMGLGEMNLDRISVKERIL
jgi:uncharacterized protein (DUF362 family)